MFQLDYAIFEKKAKQALIDQIVISTERRPSTVASWCNGKRNRTFHTVPGAQGLSKSYGNDRCSVCDRDKL